MWNTLSSFVISNISWTSSGILHITNLPPAPWQYLPRLMSFPRTEGGAVGNVRKVEQNVFPAQFTNQEEQFLAEGVDVFVAQDVYVDEADNGDGTDFFGCDPLPRGCSLLHESLRLM